MKLQNKTAIITGASMGLGLKIAEEFVNEGANVAITARSQGPLDEAIDKIKLRATNGQKIWAFAADVSSEHEMQEVFSKTVSESGELNILVNNAGIYGPKGSIDKINLKDFRNAMEINLMGTLICMRFAVDYFKKAGSGKIINLSGGGATKPLPNLSSYAASKAAVIRLTETVAREFEHERIDVNAIAPGALNTRLLDEILEAGPDKVGEQFYSQALKQKEKGGSPLQPGADLAVYLASEQSNGISGLLISAIWDNWQTLHERKDQVMSSDVYTLRRIIDKERGFNWDK